MSSKKMFLNIFAVIFFIVFLFLQKTSEAADKIPVFVSILPQKYFVEKIGGEFVDVNVMVPPGSNPETYEPKPRQMAGLTKAKVYFSIGVPFEAIWLKKIAAVNPEMAISETDAGINKIDMESNHQHSDISSKTADKDKHQHDIHGIKDPHIWTSPSMVKIIARNIYQTLVKINPENRKLFDLNLNKFIDEISMLDKEIKDLFSKKDNAASFIVFHPAWGYFAKEYGLVQVPIEIEGKNPKSGQIQKVIALAKESGIKVVFVQPQFSVQSAEAVAKEIDGEVVFADPLAFDWAANIRMHAEKFSMALK